MADTNGNGNGRKLTSSEQFVSASRIASIVAGIMGTVASGLLLYNIERQDVRMDGQDKRMEHIEEAQTAQTTQLAVMSQTETIHTDQIKANRDRTDSLDRDIVATRDRVFCLEHKQTCDPRAR